jgi:hypothetical protein
VLSGTLESLNKPLATVGATMGGADVDAGEKEVKTRLAALTPYGAQLFSCRSEYVTLRGFSLRR